MFDEQKSQNQNEPEDILAPMDGVIEPGEIKSALVYNKLKPVKPADSELPEPPSEIPPLKSKVEISPPFLNRKSFIMISIGVVILALVIGTIWVVVKLPKKTPTVSVPKVGAPAPSSAVTPAAPIAEPIAPPAVAPEIPAPSSPAIVVEPAVDTDNDGLIDKEEAAYGTAVQVADTDGDSLSDYEEIFLWKTNPLNPDSDGDGYADGVEVKNGYNPNGPGKLLEIPK